MYRGGVAMVGECTGGLGLPLAMASVEVNAVRTIEKGEAAVMISMTNFVWSETRRGEERMESRPKIGIRPR